MLKAQILLSGALLLASALHAQAASIIKIDGSSTVFPVTEAMAEEFQALQKGKVNVTVGISGTGGGFKKFCRGETDIQNASRPISSSEMESCKKAGIKYIELPIGFDATVVAVNPKNKTLNEISVADLKKIWEPESQGKITNWNQVNPKFPDQKMKLFGAGADSGTFDYFTEAIVGKAKSSRGDYTASEDDNTLVTGIANDVGAIGYLPLSYFEENKSKLKALAIIGGEKSPLKNKAVLPSKQSVEDGTYSPLSRPVFIYISEAAMKKTEIKEFVNFYLTNASKIVTQVKLVSLPAKAYELGVEHVKKNKLGTVFAGHSEVGMKIEDLMKKEVSL